MNASKMDRSNNPCPVQVRAEEIIVSILKTESSERMSGEIRIEGLSERSAAHDLAISIEDRLKSSMSQLLRGGEHTIPRVPKVLHEADSNLYEPNLVSIGPYYHGKGQAMEMGKWKHLHAILSRNRDIDLADYIEEMKAMEERARGCYTESFSLSSDEFVQMMLLDGCLIVSIMLSHQDAMRYGLPNWEQYYETLEWKCMNRDMLLLENQLPYFILECILGLVSSNRPIRPMSKLALDYFKMFYVRFLNFDVPVKEIYDHLLEQFHYHCSPTSGKHPLPSIELENLLTNGASESDEKWETKLDAYERHIQLLDYSNPPAEDLEDAGIKFKRKEKQGGILDIEFNKRSGLMEIPQLRFADGDDHIFSNLIAFELCQPAERTFFAGYVIFMDSIIKSGKDVKILHLSGIVEHNLGSHKEFARVFNQLRKKVHFNPEAAHLYHQYRQVHEYCSERRHIWRASLVRDYFKSPWVILSLLAAILLLLLTMTQTFFTAYPFAHHSGRSSPG